MANENENNNQHQNMAPIDPFTLLMWGPPPGAQPFQQPMATQNQQPVPSEQGQEQMGAGNAMQGFDFNKLMDGADKMVKLINQTQPMLKQLGPFLNLFK